jgi:hypothetical protein
VRIDGAPGEEDLPGKGFPYGFRGLRGARPLSSSLVDPVGPWGYPKCF